VSVSPRHAIAVWRRNATMYKRTWKSNVLPNFFEPVFYLAAVGIGVGAYIQEMGGMSYLEFLAPGLVCVAAMNGASYEATYNVFVRLSFDKAYDAMLTTPIEPDDVLAGEVLWAVTRASIYGGCFYLILVLSGLAPLPSSLLAIPAMLLSGLLFASFGIAFSFYIETIDVFSFYFTLFLTPLFLFSGVFFPLDERLTPLWQWVAEALPLVHPVRLARAAFAGGGPPLVIAWDVTYVVVFVAILLTFARRQAYQRLTS
jgi:lipooligosaccharide transport system permease protein